MTDLTDPEVEAAWAYEDLHVQALFKQWAEPVLAAAKVGTGDHVLDVACGTGIGARTAIELVATTGSVTGLDVGPALLTVAEAIEPRVTWTEGDACALPFDDDQFDATISEFGLMFFPDRAKAIAEMTRCTKPGGRVVVAVWEALERSDAYPITVDILQRRAGDAAAAALRAPFVLGDTDELRQIAAAAGASSVTIDTQMGVGRFPSVRSMVEADLRGWLPVMGVTLEEELIGEILTEAEAALERYVTPEGTMVFDAPAHLVTIAVDQG